MTGALIMSQAGRTRYCARVALRAKYRGANTILRSCRAPREISRSPRLANKAPVMQAIYCISVKRLDRIIFKPYHWENLGVFYKWLLSRGGRTMRFNYTRGINTTVLILLILRQNIAS